MADEKMPYESELEDWVCDNIEKVADHPEARLVDRQVWTPHGGRMDVLAVRPDGDGYFEWVVIEVKREVADGDAFLQLLRYMGSVTHQDTFIQWDDWRLPRHDSERDCALAPSTKGVLVAPDFTDKVASYMTAVDPQVTAFELDLRTDHRPEFPIPRLMPAVDEETRRGWKERVRPQVIRAIFASG